jgi:hypothetical protein
LQDFSLVETNEINGLSPEMHEVRSSPADEGPAPHGKLLLAALAGWNETPAHDAFKSNHLGRRCEQSEGRFDLTTT